MLVLTYHALLDLDHVTIHKFLTPNMTSLVTHKPVSNTTKADILHQFYVHICFNWFSWSTIHDLTFNFLCSKPI